MSALGKGLPGIPRRRPRRRVLYVRRRKHDAGSASSTTVVAVAVAAALSVAFAAVAVVAAAAATAPSSYYEFDLDVAPGTDHSTSETQLEETRAAVDKLHRQLLIPSRILAEFDEPQPWSRSARRHQSDRTLRRLSELLSRGDTAGYATFASIRGRTLPARLRAVASILEYCRNTKRVPVILWEVHPKIWRHSWSHAFFNATTIESTYDAVFVDVYKYAQREYPPLARSERDWTELAFVDLGNGTDTVDSWSGSEGRDSPLSIASKREAVHSLDSAALVRAHVAIRLFDAPDSRYAPMRVGIARLGNHIRLKQSKQMLTKNTRGWMLPLMLRAESSIKDGNGNPSQITTTILHSEFDIPLLLIEGMSPHTKTRLLWRLRETQERISRTHAQGSAQDLRLSKSDRIPYEHRLKPRIMFVHVQYGLGNRLRALGSAMAFARATNRVLVLIWEPDYHLNCVFTDLFVDQDDIYVSNSLGNQNETWPYYLSRSHDDKATQVAWYNFMRYNGEHVNDPNESIDEDPMYHIYVSTAYVIQSALTPGIHRTQSPFWSVLNTLTPTVEVGELVARLDQELIGRMMGVHIRSRRIESDIAGIGADEYSVAASRRTDYWRNLTQVDTFVDEMKRQPASQMFYVAADQVQVIERLEREFPSRVFYTPRRCDSREKECLPYALADILLLSKCSSIRGSYWSSFSEVALRISGGRFLLAGIDFGRPTPKPRISSRSRSDKPSPDTGTPKTQSLAKQNGTTSSKDISRTPKVS